MSRTFDDYSPSEKVMVLQNDSYSKDRQLDRMRDKLYLLNVKLEILMNSIPKGKEGDKIIKKSTKEFNKFLNEKEVPDELIVSLRSLY